MEEEETFKKLIDELQRDGAEATATNWMKRLEEEHGTTPLIFQKMQSCPEALVSHLLYKDAVSSAGALDQKTTELICLAVGAALRCDYCTAYHMRVAQNMGISKEEILEAILIAGLLSQSSVLANAYRVVGTEQIEKKKCGASCSLK